MNRVLEQISIVMPTRNRVEELLVTIEKMTALGFKQSSIYIADDCSVDRTYDTISKKYPEIHLYRNEKPAGQLNSRNFLFSVVETPFILSLDDDSHIRSLDDLSEAMQVLENSEDIGIFGFKAYEQLKEPPLKEELPVDRNDARTFIACGCLIKKSLLDKIGIYTNPVFGFYCEEIDCSVRAYKAGFRTVTQKNLVVHHRVDRNFRTMPKKTDIGKGIYGSVWRSKTGFSDNLIVTHLYYPPGLDLLFLGIYTAKRFYHFALLKGDFAGFFGGIMRYLRHIPYIFRHKSSLSYRQFFNWIKLPAI